MTVTGARAVRFVFGFHGLTDQMVGVGTACRMVRGVAYGDADAVGGAKGRLVADFARLDTIVQRSELSFWTWRFGKFERTDISTRGT